MNNTNIFHLLKQINLYKIIIGIVILTLPINMADAKIPISGDMNGDGIDTTGFFDSPTATFTIDGKSINFATPSDLPVIGDWDHDGKDEIGVFRPDESGQSKFYLVTRDWSILSGSIGSADYTISFGYYPDNIPIIGDWDGDGDDDIGGYKPSTSIFYLYTLNLGSSSATSYKDVPFGIVGDIPITGDWNKDSKSDIGVFRPAGSPNTNNFYLDLGLTGGQHELGPYIWGDLSDLPIMGDWDGDGDDNLGLYRPSNGQFYTDAGRPPDQVQKYTITVSTNPSGLNPQPTGGGTYNSGTTVTAVAQQISGYTFQKWTEGGSQVSTSMSYSFIVTGNRNLVAEYIVNVAPYVPKSPNPSDGVTSQATSLTLSWNGGDPNGDVVTYTVYIGTSDPAIQTCYGTSTYCSVSDLSYDTAYYWKVVASDGKSTPVIGPTWKFTTMKRSYYFISDDSIGKDCTLIGTWDNKLKTCILTRDLLDQWIWVDNNIILDGNGHTITGDKTIQQGVLLNASNSMVKNLNIRSFTYGIYLQDSANNNVIKNNKVSYSHYAGIDILSDNNILTDNNVFNNGQGIFIAHSENNNLIQNKFSNNNGTDIYLEDANNNILDGNIASTQEGVNNMGGIFLTSSNDNTIIGNRLDNSNGIFLSVSNNNTFKYNNISTTYKVGVSLDDSSNNTLIANNIIGTGTCPYPPSKCSGITLYNANNNMISDNYIYNNSYGLLSSFSVSNRIYHNGFIKNNPQAEDGSNNFWDNGAEGNYWSDFDTPAEGCNDVDNNGICDSSRTILGGSNVDRYPLIRPYGSVTPPSSGITVGQGVDQNIKNAFIDAYNREINGGESKLGKPTTEVYTWEGYLVQEFPGVPNIPGGIIMYNSNLQKAFYIHGAIWQKYKYYPNKERLGPVKSDEMEAGKSPQGTTGIYSEFETGRIHWISDTNTNHPQKGQSFVTYDDLDAKYTSLTGTNSYLGFPIMDQEERDGYDFCDFEGGHIEWNGNEYKAFSAGPDKTVFSGESVYLVGRATGTITEYHWDFGDGDISDQKEPAHRFRGSPYLYKYTVTLTAKDDKGNIGKDTVDVIVKPLEKDLEISEDVQLSPTTTERVFAKISPVYNWVGRDKGYDEYVVNRIKYEYSGGGILLGSIGSYIISEGLEWGFKQEMQLWSTDILINDGDNFANPLTKIGYYSLASMSSYDTPEGIYKGITVKNDDYVALYILGWFPVLKMAPGICDIGEGTQLGAACQFLTMLPPDMYESQKIVFDPNPDFKQEYIKPFKTSSLDIIHIASPGDLRVYDSQNRITGIINGEIKEDIPFSLYNDIVKTIVIMEPSDNYIYEVEGKDTGNYGLYIAHIDSIDENVATDTIVFDSVDIPTTLGQIHQYNIDWNVLSNGEKGVTLNVDSNGDGTFEDTIISDNTLSRQGGTSISVVPRSINVIKDQYNVTNIKVKNTQNVPDTFRVYINTSEIPTQYRADLPWFNWTEKTVYIGPGKEVVMPIKITPSITGTKMFRAKINSTTSTKVYALDTGTLKIT